MTRALHLHTWGPVSSRRVVCVHGVTASGLHFAELAEDTLAGFWVLAPDLLGHGYSDHRPPWGLEDQIASLLETVGREPALWVGHSYGGRLVLELALREPALVQGAVLLDPVIWFPPHLVREAAADACRERCYTSVEEAVERRFEESRLAGASRERVREGIEGHLVTGSDGLVRYRYSQAAVVSSIGELARTPPAFAGVRLPTLLVRGADTYLPYDHVLDDHRAALGELLTERVVAGGHTVLWDAFAETSAAVLDWLDRLGGR